MSDKKKFFFDLHNFADDAQEDEGPPPPPTFSEEELAKAKDEAYQKGKKDGFADSQESIEKQISLLLDNAKHSFMDIQAHEMARETQYEEEAIILALHLFNSIYPAWVDTHGPQEVENAISETLKQAANQQSIRIDVAPDLLAPIEARLKPIQDELSGLSITINGVDSLSKSDMRMKWTNGGAVRDTRKLAAQILHSLTKDLPEETIQKNEECLADQEETRHNEEITDGETE